MVPGPGGPLGLFYLPYGTIDRIVPKADVGAQGCPAASRQTFQAMMLTVMS